MNELTVKEIMVPLEQYATVHEDASLYEAVLAIEECGKGKGPQDARAVLVVNSENQVVGKFNQLDIVRSLEPGYKKIVDSRPDAGRVGFSRRFLKLIASDYDLWSKPMDQICGKAANIHAKDIMHKPTNEGQYVDENASINQAIHQVVMGRHQSLLVTKEEKIIGILRLTDIFSEIANCMKACSL